MRARVHRILTAGLVPRATILGMLGSLLAMAPMGALTPAAHAATGTITEFNNSNRPGIIQNSSSAQAPESRALISCRHNFGQFIVEKFGQLSDPMADNIVKQLPRKLAHPVAAISQNWAHVTYVS